MQNVIHINIFFLQNICYDCFLTGQNWEKNLLAKAFSNYQDLWKTRSKVPISIFEISSLKNQVEIDKTRFFELDISKIKWRWIGGKARNKQKI